MVAENIKFVGIIFERILSFLPLLSYLKNKCTKDLNLLHDAVHTLGADQQTLLRLYRSVIRSKLDYACIIHDSTLGSYLQLLDHIQNHALWCLLDLSVLQPMYASK